MQASGLKSHWTYDKGLSEQDGTLQNKMALLLGGEGNGGPSGLISL